MLAMVALLGISACPCQARLKTALVLPHGDFAFAPQLIDYRCAPPLAFHTDPQGRKPGSNESTARAHGNALTVPSVRTSIRRRGPLLSCAALEFTFLHLPQEWIARAAHGGTGALVVLVRLSPKP